MTTTKDFILGENSKTPPVTTGAEQNTNPIKPVGQNITTPAATTTQMAKVEMKRPEAQESPKFYSLEELYKKLNTNPSLSTEQLEKERELQRKRQIIAAVGDGVSAIANLIATSHGAPNAYTGQNTLSERTKIRYDRLLKERQDNINAYNKGLYNARILDIKNAQDWRNQLKRNKEREEALEYQKEQDDAAAAFRQQQFDYRKEQDKKEFNQRAAQHKQALEAKKVIAEAQAAARAAKGVRGKQLGFSDGAGSQMAIYENVWKGSWQQVFNTLLSENIGKGEMWSDVMYSRKMNDMSSNEKQDFVKQHWHKSQRAKDMMLALSTIDPANMSSFISNDEDFSQYAEAGDDDFSQYITQ